MLGVLSRNSSPTKYFSKNPMTFNTISAGVVIFAIAALLIFFVAIKDLLSIFKNGVFIDQRTILMKKTNKELRAMLVGVKRISSLNKNQLVDLLLEA